MERYAYYKKLRMPVVFLLFVMWGISMAYIINVLKYTSSAVTAVIVSSFLILATCLRFPQFGFYFTILFSSIFALPGRFFNAASPVGILVEMFTCVLCIAVLSNSFLKKEDAAALWKNPVTIAFGCIMIYYFVELANPAMHSKLGWFFFLRKQGSFFLFYYIAYSILDSYDKIWFYFKFWIVLVVCIALYGIKQHWFGLAAFEKTWLQSDPLFMKLFFQNGFLRKFSILSDPSAFGIICASFGIFTLILAVRTNRVKTKVLLYLATAILVLASSYSGSRTCNAMIIAALIAYAIFTLNEKKTYWLLCASALTGLLLLFGPLRDKPVISRVKTTFLGSRDASVAVRNSNRHAIQPYIYEHPIGGGLNTSGSEGQLYNPCHVLAGFPPDSGYMKILLEQGWIGFAFHLALYFLILKRGVNCFFRARNRSVKSVYIALTICLFSLFVGQYSQIAIAQYPLVLFYISALAILVRLIDYDTGNTETTPAGVTVLQHAG